MNPLSMARDALFIHNTQARRRSEHYQWVETAQLGVTYFTIAPIAEYEEFTHRKIHGSYIFVKKASWGPHAGQLLTANNVPSWRIWNEQGALTTTRMPTFNDRRDEDDRAFAGFSARAQQQIDQQAMAELQRLYPASVEHALAMAA